MVLDGDAGAEVVLGVEPAALSDRSAGYDAVGGMQDHTAELSPLLDRMGGMLISAFGRITWPARGMTRCFSGGAIMRAVVGVIRLRIIRAAPGS